MVANIRTDLGGSSRGYANQEVSDISPRCTHERCQPATRRQSYRVNNRSTIRQFARLAAMTQPASTAAVKQPSSSPRSSLPPSSIINRVTVLYNGYNPKRRSKTYPARPRLQKSLETRFHQGRIAMTHRMSKENVRPGNGLRPFSLLQLKTQTSPVFNWRLTRQSSDIESRPRKPTHSFATIFDQEKRC